MSNLAEGKVATITYDDGATARAAKTVTTGAANAEGVATVEIEVASTVTKVKVTNISVGTPDCEHTIAAVEAVPGADCQTKGTGAHYKCSTCNKLFSDENGETEIDEAPEGAVGNHTIVSVAATKGDDCQTKGVGAHYKCSVANCGKLFSDEGGENEIANAPEGEVGEHDWQPDTENEGQHKCGTTNCTETGSCDNSSDQTQPCGTCGWSKN